MKKVTHLFLLKHILNTTRIALIVYAVKVTFDQYIDNDFRMCTVVEDIKALSAHSSFSMSGNGHNICNTTKRNVQCVVMLPSLNLF